MNSKLSLPLIIGITGHRDISPENEEKLKEVFESTLLDLKAKYPNTPLIVMSALAEGADILAGEVAMKMGLSLFVPLPYNEEEYLESFDSNDNIERFIALREYASEVYLVGNEEKGEDPYQELGEHLANNCNILVAFWDGLQTDNKGGTSAVVEYTKKGFVDNHFDKLQARAIFHIKTPRLHSIDVVDGAFTVEPIFLGMDGEHCTKNEKDFHIGIKKTEEYNQYFIKKNIPLRKGLKSYKDFFDTRSKKYHGFYDYSHILIICLTWISIASLETMHVLHIYKFMWGHSVAILLAFVVYFLFIKRKKIQNRYLQNRGFVEALRVQSYWNKAGVKESAAKYYLANQHEKYAWLRNIVKNISYITGMQKEPIDIESVINKWIKGQIQYLEDAIVKRTKKLEFWERIEKYCYRTGLFVLFVIFIWFALEEFGVICSNALPFSWHYLILLSGLLFLTALSIGERYLGMRGFEEEKYNSEVLLGNYKRALRDLSKKGITDNQRETILIDLGKKALEENSRWLVLRDSSKLEATVE